MRELCIFNDYCAFIVKTTGANKVCMDPSYYIYKAGRICKYLCSEGKKAGKADMAKASCEASRQEKKEGKMSKLTIKAKVKKTVKGSGEKKVKVVDMMREKLGKNINYPFEKLLVEVKKACPGSKFDKSQYAWYKSKIANKKLKGVK